MTVKVGDLFHTLAHTLVVVVALGLVFNCPDHSNGAEYIVGGEDYKWTIPLTNDFYTNWSSSHSFVVGDTLLFEYDPELPNLFQISSSEFQSCTVDQAFKVYDGPSKVSLVEHGVFYFLCTILNYCALGQKFMVAVAKPLPPPASHPASSLLLVSFHIRRVTVRFNLNDQKLHHNWTGAQNMFINWSHFTFAV